MGMYDGTQYFFGRNEWLGNIAMNSDFAGLIFEVDQVIPNAITHTIRNFVAMGTNGGVIIGNTPYNFDGTSSNTL